MQINDIKIFYEVAHLNSTMKTANKLSYVQSNVSKRIAKLENEIGTKLFYRTNKGMTLTADGEKFLPYAEKILTAVLDVENLFSNRKKQIRIGATQAISRNYLQHYYFEENIAIFTNSSSGLIQQLIDCTIDFMVVNRKVNNVELEEITTMEETLFWTKAKGNNTTFLENTIVVSRDVHCPYRIETFDYLKKNNLNNLPIVEVDTLDMLISMLKNNQAIAILPEKTVALNDPLQSIESIKCNNATIYVYALQNYAMDFELELFGSGSDQ